MTLTPDPAPSATSPRPSRAWGWVVLGLALVVVGLIRVPLVLNARAHLDSDLAVDGLTLLDALNGHWRWHYPATPFIGSPPVLLSWVQAKIWGPGPSTLVSGGVVAYGLIVAATFLLNRRAFGPSVAAWGLIPLVFASTGTLWLSGRVTGGHLLAVAWHAATFALLWDVMTKGGWRRSAALGLWCGLGLYVDTMFAVTWVGLAVAAVVFLASLSLREGAGMRDATKPLAFEEIAVPTTNGNAMTLTPGPSPGGRGEKTGNRSVRAFVCLLVFALAAGLGVVPRFVGKWVDPHDAYVGQFEPVRRVELVARNAGILAADCLPRLIAGHRLHRLQTEPDPSALPESPRVSPEKSFAWLGLSVTVVSLGLFVGAMVVLVLGLPAASPLPPGEGPGVRAVASPLTVGTTTSSKPAGSATTLTPALSRGEREAEGMTSIAARIAIRWGLLASSLAVMAGFLVHPTITNSDNYRYLVFLLVPWSSGFGLLMARIASKRPAGAWPAGILAFGFAALMILDSSRWYARFGWVDSTGLPIRKTVDDPVLDWLDNHLGITTIYGNYWDVYRLSFLTGGRVQGVPFGEFPQRFPEIETRLPPARNQAMIVRPDGVGPTYRARALAQGGREIWRGEGFSIVQWPQGVRP